MIKPASFDKHDLDATLIDWIGTENTEMQVIELKSSTMLMTKFTELNKQFTFSTAGHLHLDIQLFPIALAQRRVFGSTYLHKQVFSYMKHVLSPTCSWLTTDHSEAFLQLKVTNFEWLRSLRSALKSRGRIHTNYLASFCYFDLISGHTKLFCFPRLWL